MFDKSPYKIIKRTCDWCQEIHGVTYACLFLFLKNFAEEQEKQNSTKKILSSQIFSSETKFEHLTLEVVFVCSTRRLYRS